MNARNRRKNAKKRYYMSNKLVREGNPYYRQERVMLQALFDAAPGAKLAYDNEFGYYFSQVWSENTVFPVQRVSEASAHPWHCRVLVFPEFPRSLDNPVQCNRPVLHPGSHADATGKHALSSRQAAEILLESYQWSMHQARDTLYPWTKPDITKPVS